MKIITSVLIGLTLACSSFGQTQATVSPSSGNFTIDDQYDSYGMWVKSWYAPNDTAFDLVRLTDSTNGGAPINAYMDNHFVVDRVGGVATLKLVEANINYNNLANKPMGGAPSYNFAVSAKTIQTTAAAANGFQVSSTRNSWVTYSVTITTATTVLGTSNSSGYVILEIAATNSTTASDWKEVGRVASGQNNALTVAVGTLTQTGGGSLSGMVPAAYYSRLRSVSVADTPTFAYNSGEEVLM